METHLSMVSLDDNFTLIKVHIICADFRQTDIYERIGEELNKLGDIYVLVNNVGTIYHIPEYFLEIPSNFTESYVSMNILSATKLIQMLLPKMVEKKSGIIINVSSQMADYPYPLYASYSASN